MLWARTSSENWSAEKRRKAQRARREVGAGEQRRKCRGVRNEER